MGRAVAAVLVLSSAPVIAQEAQPLEAHPLEAHPLEAQAGRVATFDIPAQPLSQALTAFGRQSGMQVAFDPAAAAGKTSVALGGSMTTEQALRTLLGASGLSYQFTSSGAVTVSGASGGGSGAMQLDPVRVQSNVVPPQAMIDNLPPPYSGGQVATGGQVGLLGERTFMNTPFNQNSYTDTLIENQQARSVADVLDNDPSVRTNYASAAGLDQATIRGFDASDISFNGLYGVAPSRSNVVAIEGIERVEVLRGPSAMLFGMAPRGNVGGNINVVPKRAGETPVTRFTGSYISATQFGGHIDVGRRFGTDNSFGARFNGVVRDGTTSVNGQSAYTGLAVLGLDFRRDNLRMSLDAGYQKQRTTATRRPLAVLPNVPVPQAPPPQNNWSQPWSLADLQDVYGAFRAEIDPFENVTAYVTVGGNLRQAKYLSENLTLQNVNGLVTGSTNVSVSSQTSSTVEGGVRARGNTGPIAHDFALAGNLFWYQLGTIANNVALPASNYNFRGYAPVPNQGGLPLPQDAPRTQWQQLSSVGAADTLSILDQRIQLTIGGRQQQVQARNFAVTGAVTSNYDQSVFSPMFALVVKPIENLSVYGNFIQGLQPGASAPIGTLNAGQVFAPYVSRQYEVGVKWNLGTFATTLSAFQISQPSAITNPVTNVFTVDGEQVNKGLEFMTFGEPLKGFRLLGGFTLLDARLTQTAGGLNQGNKAPGVADFMLNATTEWDASFLSGLTFMGRVIYTSAQYINNANTQAVPAWTRLDLGARYRFELAGQGVTVRANMENVLNAGYWNVANGTSIGLSYPRTFLLSAAIDF